MANDISYIAFDFVEENNSAISPENVEVEITALEGVLIAEYKFNNAYDIRPLVDGGYSYSYSDTNNGDGTTTRIVYGNNAPTSINFEYCEGLLEVYYVNIDNMTNLQGMFTECVDLVYVNTTNWDTKNITNMNNLFVGCESLISLDVSNWNTEKVTDMSYMFNRCISLTNIEGIENLNVARVTTMDSTFRTCSSLINLDLSKWNTNSLTNMRFMFQNCNSLVSLNLNNWNTNKVTKTDNMARVLSDVTALKDLYVKNWPLSNTTQTIISSLPEGDDDHNIVYAAADFVVPTGWVLEKPKIAVYKFNNGTDTLPTFNYGYTYTYEDVVEGETTTRTIYSNSLPTTINFISSSITELIYLNISNITDFTDMFYDCNNLVTVNASDWDTSRVTNMRDMFNYCHRLTNIDLSNWDTSNVTNMSGMFSRCSYNLTSLDLSNWDTGKVTDMSYMFSDCSKLTSLDLNNFDTSKVTNIANMFSYCDNLTTVNMSNSNTDSINKIINILPARTSSNPGTLTISEKNSSLNESAANSKYWNISTDLPPDESEDNLLTLNKANETINVKQEKELTAICEQNVLWSVNNDNITIETLNNISNVVLYGQVATVELKNCEIAQTINSFNVVSYTSSEVTVKFRIFNLDPNETYTFSTSYLSGTNIEIYYGDEYQSGSTSKTFNLTGSDSYTFVFYRRNGTTENWGLSDLLLVDSSGNDNMDSFSSKTIRIIGRSEGTSIITCTTEDGTLSDTCTVTVTNFTGYNLGSERGLYSWKDENLLSNTLLFNTINTLNITELYQSIDGEYFENNANIISESINTLKSNTNTNLKVYYLNGDPSWYAKYDSIKKRIDNVLDFNTNNAYNVTIDGVVLDIEPWASSSIKETDWSATYLNTISQVYNYCQANSIELQLVVPYWLDTNSMFENYPDFYKSVIDNCDTLQIMNFNKSGVVNNIKNEIEYAISKNKKIVSIAECNPVNDEHGVTESLTFYNDGIDAVHESWLSIYNTYEYDNLCFAYHDFHNAMTGWINEGLLSVKISNEIRLGNLEINNMYIGEDEIKEVYLGDILLYKKH